MARYDDIINFWFGHVEQTVVPSKERARIWFGASSDVDLMIKEQFVVDYDKACLGELDSWGNDGRGQLGLILMLDQFSRHIHRNTPLAYVHDNKAMQLCLKGLENHDDHSLSLIERAFYYFPLLHTEDLVVQQYSVDAYKQMIQLALPETKNIYDTFLRLAIHHHGIIEEFGRFPQRNKILNRESTLAEVEFLHKEEEIS